MKILFIGSNPKNAGGIETFGRNLKKIFKDELYFFSYGTHKTSLYDVSNVIIFEKKKYYLKFLRKKIQKYTEKKFLRSTIKKINPDIIILNSPQNLKQLKGIKQKKILVQHRTAEEYWKTDSYFNKEKKLLKKVKNEIDYIVTLSPYDKIEFIEKFKIKEEKIVTIRHMSEIPLIPKKNIAGKSLIVISRLTTSKRLDLAVNAMLKLPDYTLKIYGEGKSKKYLENLIKIKNIKNVKICGVTNETSKKLNENSIFIMTSDHEGYGITNIEAMRSGLPILIRNTFTAAKDIIGKNGILLNKNWDEDSFVTSVKDIYKNYEIYSEESFNQGSRHDLKIIKKEWEKLIEKCKI